MATKCSTHFLNTTGFNVLGQRAILAAVYYLYNLFTFSFTCLLLQAITAERQSK